ncbi:MAG: hypothetical protein AB7H77_11100 [Bdellovibrionales bacterium]
MPNLEERLGELQRLVRVEPKGLKKEEKEKCAREDREMRENLSEAQIDKTLADSFPASDPPATY